MTNEELVFLIQEGHEEYTLDLWLQVEKFIQMKATEFYNKLPTPHGITPEDLAQEGFFAVLDAVKTFARDKECLFLTWLSYYLKPHFYVCAGIRTERSRRDPITTALSLDVPLTADTQDTYADVVADPEDKYEEAERMIYCEQLRKTLDSALDKLPEKESTAIRMRFYDSLTLKEAGEKAGVAPERIRALQQKGMRKLRQSARRNGLEKYIDAVTSYFPKTSFNNSWISPTEAVVLKREDLRQWLEARGVADL